MLSELFSENAKQQLFEEFSNIIDDLAEMKAKQEKQGGRYVNKKQACKYLNLSYGTFTKLVQKNFIKPIDIPVASKIMFDKKQLDEFMASRQRK